VLENRPLAELHEAIDFCLDVGLPTTLRDFGLQEASAADLQAVGESAMDPANVIHATPVTLSATLVSDVIKTTSTLAQQSLSKGKVPATRRLNRGG
jgi:glycerol dehydrogenase